jgi:hypothetical protein
LYSLIGHSLTVVTQGHPTTIEEIRQLMQDLQMDDDSSLDDEDGHESSWQGDFQGKLAEIRFGSLC